MKKAKSTNPRIGAAFDDFLMERGIREEVDAIAQKRILAWQIQEAMRSQGLTKTAMAARMDTSRAALDRLLDPENGSVTLTTMSRATAAIGARLQMNLVPLRGSRNAGEGTTRARPVRRTAR